MKLASRKNWTNSVLSMKEVKEFRNGNLMVPPANAPMTLTLIESACEDVYTQTSYDPSFELSRDRLLLGE